MSKIVPRRLAGHGRTDRVAAVLCGALLSVTALVGPVSADDTDGQVAGQGLTQEQSQKLISNLQDLSKADSSQAEMEEGFAIASTFSDIAGQPEVGFAISGLQQLVQFSGIFSSGSTNATSEAIATLTKDVAQIKSDLDRLNSVVANNAAVQADQHNQEMLKNVYDANQKLNDIAAQIYPASSQGSSVGGATAFCKLNGSCPAAAPVVTSALLEQIAGVMNEFIDQQKSYFIGDDLDAGKNVRPGFKPQPALNVYLASLRMYLGAMTAYAHGNPSVILNDRGTAQRKPFVYDLKRHAAFLRAQANGGSNPAGPPPQDQIINAIGCGWSGSSGAQGGGQYPDASGQCVSSGAVCTDNISRRKLIFGRNDIKGIDLHLSWQQDRNAFCSPPSGAPLEQLEALLFAKYGVPAMNGTASLVEHMARTGFPADVTPYAGKLGGSGGVKGSTFFVYGTGALGAVNLYSGAPGGGLMKPVPEGFIPEATALLPGGSNVFYALTKDGTLNWYRFHTGDKNQKPFDGPVAVSSNLTGYTRIFGGGDGVIYAIRTDGSLVWFRHTGFMTGTGSLSEPKVINAGWGSFKNVFSAGSGVIYAIRSDGGLVWYRHRDYLTGDSKDATPPPAARGTTAHPSARNTTIRNSVVAAANALLVAHFDGPTDVGTGWADFKRVIPAGDGVLLALRSDGRLDWYRHQDYLTGTSTTGTPAPNAAGGATAPVNSSVWGAQSAATSPGARSYGATGNTAALGMAAPGAPATTFGSPSYRAQTRAGTSPATTSALSSNSYASNFGGSPQAGETLTGGRSPGPGSRTVYGATAHLTIGTPHWDGPRTVEAHTDLGALNAIAAPLPATDLGPTNGLH